MRSIDDVIAREGDSLMDDLPGIEAVVEGEGGVIEVWLTRKSHETEEKVPSSPGGYPVRTRITGEFSAQQEPEAPTSD